MRDYEELIERLRAGTYTIEELSIILPDAADAIEELQYQIVELNKMVPKWISVGNELPKKELRTYWVYTSVGSQHSCRWTNNRFGLGVSDKWGWSVFDIPQYTIVTHWMNLPEPPKEYNDG